METTIPTRKPYPTDVSDEEWAFVVPSLALMTPDAPQRRHDLREVVNALHWIVRAGSPWRLLPTTFPPWAAVCQQTRRWLAAGVFAAMAHDLRMLLREAAARMSQPRAVIRDSRTVQSTPESGAGAGFDGHKKRRGRKTHAAVDTLGHLLALVVTPANAQDRAQVAALAAAVQDVTGESVELAYVDQGYTGEQPRPTRRGTKSSSTRSRSPSLPPMRHDPDVSALPDWHVAQYVREVPGGSTLVCRQKRGAR
jgi:transposase